MSRKLEELKNKYGVSERSVVLIGRMDPTTNQKYIEWLFKVRYISLTNGKYRLNPDFPASLENPVKESLIWFERNLNGKIPTDFRDINKFKTVNEFLLKVQELNVPSRSEVKNDVRVVFEDDNWKILVPLSFDSSKLYGMGTKWCTTQKGYYDNYMREGFLYYIIDKRINRKFGVPINSNKGLSVNVSSFTFYNNEDAGLNLNQIKLIYGDNFNFAAEKVKDDFVQQLKLKLKTRFIIESKASVQRAVEALRSVDLTNDEVNELLTSVLKTIGVIK
jgi:hypothetical protein